MTDPNEVFSLNPNDIATSKDSDTSSIFIEVSPCSEYDSGPDGNPLQCDTENFTYFKIDLVYPTYSRDLSNRDNPVQVDIRIEEALTLSNFKLVKSDQITPINVEIVNESLFFGLKKTFHKSSYIEFQYGSPEFDFRGNNDGKSELVCNELTDCQYFYKASFYNSFKKKQVIRKYKPIIEVLSEIGGISTLLLQVFTYLNMIYLYFARQKIITQRVLPVLQQNTHRKTPASPKDRIETETDSFKTSDQESVDLSAVQQEASELVEQTLDFSNLFHELCMVKVLAELILKDTDKQKLVLSALQLIREKKRVAEISRPWKSIEPQNGNKSRIINLGDANGCKREKQESNPRSTDPHQVSDQLAVRLFAQHVNTGFIKAFNALHTSKKSFEEVESVTNQNKEAIRQAQRS